MTPELEKLYGEHYEAFVDPQDDLQVAMEAAYGLGKLEWKKKGFEQGIIENDLFPSLISLKTRLDRDIAVANLARQEGFAQGKHEGTISGKEQGAEQFVSLLKAELNLESEVYGGSGFGEGKIISIRAVQAIVSSKSLDTLLREYIKEIASHP